MENKNNFLNYVPVLNCPWDKDGKGHVYLIKEKTKNKLLKKVIGWLGRSQDFHIHLDDLGTAAWLAVDGRRTVLEIASSLQQGSGGLAQAEQRLAKFFALLARDKFIVLKTRDSA
ncbi:MAG: PqqD family peptide modification chaperone [Acidobacteria bacterium]|jgi:hypothetical protein|nr:PqqD family peptide modification chaperone [Acidobacteriota bacterium]